MHARLVTIALVILAAACGSSPMAPAPVLSVSQSSAALSRTSTVQVTATSTQSGAITDVTATATWQSSNAQVATVTAGVITAVGPGTAMVSVAHAGQSQSVAVTVRRRVFLKGEVAVRNLAGHNNVGGIEVRLADHQIGYHGNSGYNARFSSSFGIDAPSQRLPIEPGSHQLTVGFEVGSLPGQAFSPQHTIEFSGPAAVVDADTGEEVGVLTLENRQGTFSGISKETWTVTIGVFTSCRAGFRRLVGA